MRLPELVTQLRDVREADPREYISTWTEKDVLDGKVVDAWVIIFRTRGCYWARKSGCSMCGYVNDVAVEVAPEDLAAQLEKVLPRHNGQPFVKVYTSGNFFDDHEVFPEVRGTILKALGERCEKVMVETLAHLVRREPLEQGRRFAQKFEIALGLESANDVVLRHAVNKFWGLKEHVRAANLAHEVGATVKSYLLLKPPFLTEREAIEDVVETAHAVDGVSDTISINPMNVQRATVVDHLFHRGEYRPPWLWSVAEVLRRCRDLKAQVKSHPTAGGMRRGAHNCGTCDESFIRAIEDFSLGLGDRIDDLACVCREEWLDTLELQGFTHGAADLSALLRG
ncbi:MAG TPA: archaeosine biosynthesis radical SAM protein RaSEA [Thermoplasmata archaeon]|nr:archaeosine biosynthesis radical SAM protein RaSEA [Thermoplasmata archaeon]